MIESREQKKPRRNITLFELLARKAEKTTLHEEEERKEMYKDMRLPRSFASPSRLFHSLTERQLLATHLLPNLLLFSQLVLQREWGNLLGMGSRT